MVAMKPTDVLILAIHVLTLNSGVRTVVVLQLEWYECFTNNSCID